MGALLPPRSRGGKRAAGCRLARWGGGWATCAVMQIPCLLTRPENGRGGARPLGLCGGAFLGA